MAWVATAVTAVGIGTSYLSSKSSQKASSKASAAQTAASQAAIEEQRRQFDKVQETLAPYTDAGQRAMLGQMRLLGLGGGGLGVSSAEAQQREINKIEQSPLFQAKIAQGEQALLQQAAATGGLRGGNVQSALAQFRPQMLEQEINNQFQRYGQLAGLGQASAAGVGSAAQQTGAGISSQLGQMGAAQAGGILSGAQAQNQFLGDVTGSLAWLGQKKGWF